MKILKYFIISFVFASFFLTYSTSCTFDNEEDLLKDFVCDTTDIKYDDLTYIFTGICTICHSESYTENDEIIMDSYDNVKASINTGLVIPAINHTGPYNMPNGLPKLSDCDIAKIEAWFNNGMPEN